MSSRHSIIINRKVNQYHLAFQIRQTTYISLDIFQLNINDGSLFYLVLRNIQFCLPRSPCILHTFNNHIIKVARTVCMRISIIQTGCHSCKTFNIIFIGQRIKKHIPIQSLEQSKICISHIRSRKNIFTFHFILIVIDH